MYFQRQHGLQCTLHACNNAIGAKVLIAADLNKAADELALAMATRSQEAQRRTGTGRTEEELGSLQARCRMALVGPAGGQWSADCAWHALAKKGYFAHRRAAADFDFKGDWIVLGIAKWRKSRSGLRPRPQFWTSRQMDSGRHLVLFYAIQIYMHV
jgi:hypothetical protein